MSPMTSPSALTTIATTAFSSPFDLPMAPRIRPIGPSTIGKNKKAMAPQMMPATEKPLPADLGVGMLAGAFLDAPQLGQNWLVSAMVFPQLAQNMVVCLPW